MNLPVVFVPVLNWFFFQFTSSTFLRNDTTGFMITQHVFDEQLKDIGCTIFTFGGIIFLFKRQIKRWTKGPRIFIIDSFLELNDWEIVVFIMILEYFFCLVINRYLFFVFFSARSGLSFGEWPVFFTFFFHGDRIDITFSSRNLFDKEWSIDTWKSCNSKVYSCMKKKSELELFLIFISLRYWCKGTDVTYHYQQVCYSALMIQTLVSVEGHGQRVSPGFSTSHKMWPGSGKKIFQLVGIMF